MGPYGLEKIRNGEGEDFHTYRETIERTIGEGELRSYTEWADRHGETVEAEGMFRISPADAETAIECLLAEFDDIEVSRVRGGERVNFSIQLDCKDG